MDLGIKIINTKYFDAKKYFVTLLIPTFALFPLFMFLGLKFNIELLKCVSIAFLIIPLLLIGQVLKVSKKNVTIKFYDEYFLLEFTTKNSKKETIKKYAYTDIESAQVRSSSGLYSNLKLKFSNNNKFQYTFKDEKALDDKPHEYSMSELLYKSICNYRNKLTPQNRIVLCHPFLASKYGFIVMIALTTLTLTAVIIHLYSEPKTIFMLSPSIVFYARLINGRRSDLATYDKMKDI